MNRIVKIIEKYSDNIILNQDGARLSLKINDAISQDEIKKFENENSVILPQCFIDLLIYSDGVDLFGQTILPLRQMNFISSEKALIFHEWGNGDFDCILFKEGISSCAIYFIEHSVENLVQVSSSLYEWIEGVIQEIKNTGSLLHPTDYKNDNYPGLYSKIDYNF